MAKAHLVNLAERRDQLAAQRDAITKEIDKISELLEKGVQEIKLRTIVEEENSVQPKEEEIPF